MKDQSALWEAAMELALEKGISIKAAMARIQSDDGVDKGASGDVSPQLTGGGGVIAAPGALSEPARKLHRLLVDLDGWVTEEAGDRAPADELVAAGMAERWIDAGLVRARCAP